MPGLLSRLFGGPPRPAAETLAVTVYSGTETLEVVGESHYQDALWQIAGGRRSDRVRHGVYAILEPEPSNRHDPNAVKVVIGRSCVGYLAREDAAAYREGLLRLMASCETGIVALQGVIVGGGPRPDGLGFLGVFLDHDPSDFGLARQYTTGGRLRTGLTEALATDLEDDSYDLSWLRTLAAEDTLAIEQLRGLLAEERDPIDRHYMLCELESRLYRIRDSGRTALTDFDAVCAQHHREMDVIRPALVEKFGVVPVIEMYRQAAIRAQKAKAWEEARAWAQRGIEVYGDHAARSEVVDDLRKRLAYAIDKATGRSEARSAAPRSARVRTAVPTVEQLVCRSCGSTFERQRIRGRKPTLCPSCRGPART